MTLEQQGAYVRLLAIQWKEGSIPADNKAIARLLSLVIAEDREMLDLVLEKFEPVRSDHSRLINPRLEEIRTEQERKHEHMSAAGKKGMESRWGKSSYKPVITKLLQSESESDRKKINKESLSSFDFEKVYAEYPRHEGKTKGVEKLKQTIKTQEEYEKLLRGIKAFSEKCKREGTDAKYIPHFATFVNQRRWEEYAAQGATSPKPPKPKRDEFDDSCLDEIFGPGPLVGVTKP